MLRSGDTARLKQCCGRARAWPLAVALALPGTKSGSLGAKHSKASYRVFGTLDCTVDT